MNPKKVHFVGIGGIGISGLAQLFLDQGIVVTGSDRAMSPVTDLLERKGITVLTPQRADNVPEDADLVVYSDAVVEGSEGYPERLRARELGITEQSYFEALGDVSKGRKTVAVAGTHGKTTTTGMLARILVDAGASPTAVVGSIVRDFSSNYVGGESDLFVVEACEYKDHLLQLFPQILVVTNLEWDHTDYFPSLQALQATFKQAIERVPKDGYVVTDPHNPNIAPLLEGIHARVVDYTLEPAYPLQLMGVFNQNNARAAAAASRLAYPSVSETGIRTSLAAFHGTWRRLEYKGTTAQGAEVFDDYAHHPTAVAATLEALRAKVPGRIIVAFHPHLYSRTRDLLDEFATAFTDADKVLIAPIYAAREVDDGSISSEILASRIRANGVDATALDFDAIENELRNAGPTDTVITMGAGDIYKIADSITAKM
jgi:UDP-N-acetylmuramate--alanine ligase